MAAAICRAACPRGPIPRTGVITLYNIVPRPAGLFLPVVILSRRACGVSKNLLWLPRSNCYAIMPAFYTQTLLHSCKILRLRASLSARHFAQDDMRAAGCPRGLIPRERCPLCLIPRTGVITLQNPLRGQRECRRCLIPRSARMTTVRGACLKRSLPAGCRARLA